MEISLYLKSRFPLLKKGTGFIMKNFHFTLKMKNKKKVEKKKDGIYHEKNSFYAQN
jgi:hypothetical protein